MEKLKALSIPYNEQTAYRLKTHVGLTQRKLVDLFIKYGFCTAEETKSMRSRVSAALTGARSTGAYVSLLNDINKVLDLYEKELASDTEEDIFDE